MQKGQKQSEEAKQAIKAKKIEQQRIKEELIKTLPSDSDKRKVKVKCTEFTPNNQSYLVVPFFLNKNINDWVSELVKVNNLDGYKEELLKSAILQYQINTTNDHRLLSILQNILKN